MKNIIVEIYIDESGTLGKDGNPYFILAAIVPPDQYSASKCLKKIRQNHLKKEYRQLDELKFNNSSKEIVRRILTCIVKHDIQFYYIAHEKKPAIENLTDLSCRLTGQLICGISASTADTCVYIDRYLNGWKLEQFNRDLTTIIGPSTISHVDSRANPGIQIADFIAGALYTYHNRPDDENGAAYYEIIQNNLTKIT
ncbi:MAG: DUF3800 domain-containing protein [Methanocorpusculum sp.]|jgi:hypothetical protein|nr:DUF3800 domain-containing protein [Methanocorpusculum sp.]MDD2471084.1 DUF3800 domain-containing protein [Methanocorpusculum sp.]